jgi:predicted metal-dependent RNase
MTVGKDPKAMMEMTQAIHAVKSIGPPDCYLGNDCKKDRQGRWCIKCKKPLMEAIKRVERMFGALKKWTNPMETGDHPKLDESKVMNNEGHQKHQMFMGMLVWVVTIRRIDVAHSTTKSTSGS